MRTVKFHRNMHSPAETALFHQWAQESDEDGNSSPVAIVEFPDGHVETIYSHRITFVDPIIDAARSK